MGLKVEVSLRELATDEYQLLLPLRFPDDGSLLRNVTVGSWRSREYRNYGKRLSDALNRLIRMPLAILRKVCQHAPNPRWWDSEDQFNRKFWHPYTPSGERPVRIPPHCTEVISPAPTIAPRAVWPEEFRKSERKLRAAGHYDRLLQINSDAATVLTVAESQGRGSPRRRARQKRSDHQPALHPGP